MDFEKYKVEAVQVLSRWEKVEAKWGSDKRLPSDMRKDHKRHAFLLRRSIRNLAKHRKLKHGKALFRIFEEGLCIGRNLTETEVMDYVFCPVEIYKGRTKMCFLPHSCSESGMLEIVTMHSLSK